MAGEGAALGRGITLGRQALSSGSNLGPVISLAGRSPVTSSTVRPQGVTQRKSAAEIRSLAAAQVLEEKKLALLEKQQALEEKKVAMVEQQAREKRLNDYYSRTEKMGIKRREQTNLAQDRATAASDKAYESGRRVSAVGKADLASAQKDAYGMAKAGLQSGNSAPLLDYFDRFGSSNMSITSMEIPPGQEDGPISVKFSNGGATTFKNKGQALLMLLAPTNPDYAGVVAQRKEDREERKVVAKEKEVDIKEGKGGLTEKDRSSLREKYDKQFTDMVNKVTSTVTEADRDTWVSDRMKTHGETAPPAKGIAPPGKQADTQEAPPVQGAKKAPDGNWYVLKDGKYHKVVAKEKQGETVTPAGGEESSRGAVYKQPIEKPEAKGIPTEKKDQAKKQGTASYKDKQGNTVTINVDSKGNLTKNVTAPKKKKKKKKKGNNK